MSERREFLKVRTEAQRDRDRWTISQRPSPAEERDQRAAAKARIRALIEGGAR